MQNPGMIHSRARIAEVAGILLLQIFFFTVVGRSNAQTNASVPSAQVTAVEQSPSPGSTAATALPVITFADALQRATANHPQTQAALTAFGLAHQDLVQSRAGLLPNVSYSMSDISTQVNYPKSGSS